MKKEFKKIPLKSLETLKGGSHDYSVRTTHVASKSALMEDSGAKVELEVTITVETE